MVTLPEMLATTARLNAGRPAVNDGGRELTYLDLRREIKAVAGRLADLGVGRGTPVSILLPNGAAFVATFVAAVELGAIAVPLNSRYQEEELSRFVGDCKAAVLVGSRESESLCRRCVEGMNGRCELLVLDLEETLAPEEAPSDERSGVLDTMATGVSPEDIALYQYSSGSTGTPKRIARTHANLVFELTSLAKTLSLTNSDRFIGVVPMSHVNGLVRSMLASLSVGATLFPLGEYRRQQVAEVIERERITVFIGVPFMFSILAETRFRRPFDLSSLRLCVSASAPMPVEANVKFREKYGFNVRQLYGSTETGTISVNMSSDLTESLASVGQPIEGAEVRIFRDDGTEAKVDEVGEVAVRSPAAITRYDGAVAEQPFRDGYFFTSDLGRIDGRSNIFLVGRKSFFINKGGYKINPWEIETLLEAHEKVKEVVVVGIPTPYGDERVKAVIVPRGELTEQEVAEYFRGKIADFKVPSIVEFREELPKGPTGKTVRSKLV